MPDSRGAPSPRPSTGSGNGPPSRRAPTTRIAVIGAWHQASVVSACFADMGYQVRGIGEDPEAISGLNLARPPVYEPGLEEMIRRNIEVGRLRYTMSYEEGLEDAEFAFVWLETPVGPGDKSDLKPVYDAVARIAGAVSGDLTLCVSAQEPVGTCSQFQQLVAAKQPGHRIPVVYVPEFLRLGSAIETFKQADRFVIGAADPDIAQRVAALYSPLGRPIRITDVRSAEMAKHASNVFLATSISFINEIADLCEAVGADIVAVADILKLDRRIGPHAYLSAGLGYAGGTLGREIQALKELGRRHGVATELLAAVESVNARRMQGAFRRIRGVYPELKGVRAGILGLTYKAGTSTLRRSAALELIDLLEAEGARVAAYDPLANLEELRASPSFVLCGTPREAAQDASMLVLVAPWQGIEQVEWQTVASAMRQPVFLDTGNFLPRARLEDAGFRYLGIGRGRVEGPG